MGADIHVFLLKRNKLTDGLEWLRLYMKNEMTDEFENAYIGEGRNYALFSKLAGVRGIEDEISCGYDGFVPGCPKEVTDEFDEYGGHTAKYFVWDTLKYCAKLEGMTEYMEECYDTPEYNIVEDWMRELETILDAYSVYATNEVYVQIFFDN